MALLAVVVGTDFAGLCIALALTGGSPEVQAMVALRIWPGVVHLLGIVCFGLGLLVVSPNPPKVRRVLSEDDARQLRWAGSFLLVFGVGMKMVALGSQGIHSIPEYFANIYAYNVEQRELGTFWDWGTELAMFGCAIASAGYEHRPIRQFALAVLMAALAFFLTSSRAGIVGGALVFFIVAVAFNPTTWRQWLRPRLVAAFLAMLVVTSGIKTQSGSSRARRPACAPTGPSWPPRHSRRSGRASEAPACTPATPRWSTGSRPHPTCSCTAACWPTP